MTPKRLNWTSDPHSPVRFSLFLPSPQLQFRHSFHRFSLHETLTARPAQGSLTEGGDSDIIPKTVVPRALHYFAWGWRRLESAVKNSSPASLSASEGEIQGWGSWCPHCLAGRRSSCMCNTPSGLSESFCFYGQSSHLAPRIATWSE